MLVRSTCLLLLTVFAALMLSPTASAQDPDSGTATPTASPTPVALATAAPGSATLGAVKGSVSGPMGVPAALPVLVVPGESVEPLQLEAYGEQDSIPLGSRTGIGLVKPDSSGAFEIRELPPGTYLIVVIAPAAPELESPSRQRAEVAFGGVVLAHPAEKIEVAAGSTVEVRFATVPAPVRNGSLKITAITYDPVEQTRFVPDRIAAVQIQPLPAGAEIVLHDDGSATVLNLPPGAYEVSVLTAFPSQFQPVTWIVEDGKESLLVFRLRPPDAGLGIALPSTGQASSSRADPLVIGAALVLATVVAAGAVVAVRRRAS